MKPDQQKRLQLLLTVSMAWEMYPHLRFGQLVSNVLDVDPFYVEDDEALDLFTMFLDRAKDV